MSYQLDRMVKVSELVQGSVKEQMTQFYRECVDCEKCTARKEAKAPTVGIGNTDAEILIVGRNPGKQEDSKGIPFVGPGGELLTNWLGWVGLEFSQLYITNMVKCYTTSDRPPTDPEIITCAQTWLSREMQILPNVKLVLAMGDQVCVCLTGHKQAEVRSTVQRRYLGGKELSIIACIHPGAPLHSAKSMPNFKNDAYFTRSVILNHPQLSKSIKLSSNVAFFT